MYGTPSLAKKCPPAIHIISEGADTIALATPQGSGIAYDSSKVEEKQHERPLTNTGYPLGLSASYLL